VGYMYCESTVQGHPHIFKISKHTCNPKIEMTLAGNGFICQWRSGARDVILIIEIVQNTHMEVL